MDPTHLSALIRKWKSGQASESEKEELEAHWQQARQDESYLQSLPEAERAALREGMYQNIWQAIGQAQRASETEPADAVGRGLHAWLVPDRYWRVAAAIGLILLAGAAAYYSFWQPAFLREHTAFGKRRQITLPDQSVVILNGNSTLRYARRWQPGQVREVWLEGEAYFSVQHQQNHQRFVVHTAGNLQVEVLGTKFSVNHRRGNTKVILQEGKVKVSAPSQSYLMKPGELVQYAARAPRLVHRPVNPRVATSWKDNLLVYQGETIGTIIDQLRDSHGLKVQFINQAIRQEVFNGSLPSDSVEVLFGKLEKLYGVEVIRRDDLYIIQ